MGRRWAFPLGTKQEQIKALGLQFVANRESEPQDAVNEGDRIARDKPSREKLIDDRIRRAWLPGATWFSR